MHHSLKIAAWIPIFVFGLANGSVAGLQAIIPPGATTSAASAVDGNDVVGTYQTGNGQNQGFFYNGSTFTTLSIPGYATDLRPQAVSGNDVVGYAYIGGGTEGFLYNTATGSYTILDPLSNRDSLATGVSGNLIVGTSSNNNGGFYDYSYNIITGQYTNVLPSAPPGDSISSAGTPSISGTKIVGSVEITPPGSPTSYMPYISQGGISTILPLSGYIPTAVSGNNIVGFSGLTTGKEFGFLLNGSTLTSLIPPGAIYSNAAGVSGNTVVGTFETNAISSQSFIYSISSETYSILSAPDGTPVNVTGVSGNNIVGYDYDVPGVGYYGFIYSSSIAVPEPSSLLSACLAIMCIGALMAYKKIMAIALV
jgi:hypothetical protein